VAVVTSARDRLAADTFRRDRILVAVSGRAPSVLRPLVVGLLLAAVLLAAGLWVQHHQRNADSPVSACPITSWCTSLVPS
jgi:hypothetical protein